MNKRRVFKLMVDLPFLKKGILYAMYDSSADVHWIDHENNESTYPLRPGLAAYLWLLCTERKYMKQIERQPED